MVRVRVRLGLGVKSNLPKIFAQILCLLSHVIVNKEYIADPNPDPKLDPCDDPDPDIYILVNFFLKFILLNFLSFY